MTFQIALIGSAGLVIGSDRNTVYISPEPDGNNSIQRLETNKFSKNPSETVFCVNAGGLAGATIAKQIASSVEAVPSETIWEKNLQDIAISVNRRQEPWPVDEIIVGRADRPDAVWLVTKYVGSSATVIKVISNICTGDRSHARFLPAILWNPSLPIDRLEALAHLTLSYASQLNPSGVGLGYDFLTIRENQIKWNYSAPIGFNKSFTDNMLQGLAALPTF